MPVFGMKRIIDAQNETRLVREEIRYENSPESNYLTLIECKIVLLIEQGCGRVEV